SSAPMEPLPPGPPVLCWSVFTRGPAFLLADPEPLDQFPVPLPILVLEVVEEAAPGADHLEEAAAGMMVLCERAEVLGQAFDPLAEKRNLDLGRPGVGRMNPVGGDDLAFPVFRQCHRRLRLPGTR